MKQAEDLRLEKELSQETVAFEVEISRDHLSNIENGKHSINIKTLYKLAEFFGVDMKYFFLNCRVHVAIEYFYVRIRIR